MIQRITQSFIKSMREYLIGDLCGNIIKAQWVDDRLLESEEPGAMELGSYFEFLLTGALPKNGKVPLPVYMSSKIKANGGTTEGLGVADMYDDYRKVHANVELVRGYLKAMGLKPVRVGVKLTKGRFEGTIDIIAEVVEVVEGFTWNIGHQIAIDTKYSGLMGETVKWKNKHGWQWSPVQKEYHGTQAKQYHFVSNLDVYFLVTQSNNEKDNLPMVKFFFTPVDEFMIEQHITEGNSLMSKFETLNATIGFYPRPSLSKCIKCPLYEECQDKHTFPRVEVIDLNVE